MINNVEIKHFMYVRGDEAESFAVFCSVFFQFWLIKSLVVVIIIFVYKMLIEKPLLKTQLV